MNKNNNIKVEILAPAGSYDTFVAVLNAGADAVYLGGQMFGARAYAGNLSSEEVINAINYAHIHNKRLYLTVNTLLKNNEIFNGLYEYIRPFYEVGLDGVIVQDYGVMKFIHDNFPNMEIHASTQMTITDSGYSDFLKRYNVTRIVPARELSLDDIRLLRKNTDFEIEAFHQLLESIGFGALNAYALMVFCLLYVPCTATIATIKKETNSWKWTIGLVIMQLVVAWAMAVLVFQVGNMVIGG